MSALRFAALVRVSTEKQEKQGESLSTQSKQIDQAVGYHRGTIAKWYKGQEHATPGYERELLNELLRDAQRSPKIFDAVVVADESRWSRDNVSNEIGLNTLRANGIRFFVLATEHDLYDHQTLLCLTLFAAFGGFQAKMQNRKSILNRIERAKSNAPTCGKLPFGRAWDETTRTWSIVPDKAKLIQDVAKRYLAGTPLPSLAAEYNINHSHLHKTLMQRCGETWLQRFKSDADRIDETVPTTIPRLLDEAIIQACLARADRNKTFRGNRKHEYLLGGVVRCGSCGYAMLGQTNHNGHRYYRHGSRDGAGKCKCKPRPWVRADELEAAVIEVLFETFGNPKALERAIEEATPNSQKLRDLRDKYNRLLGELDKLKSGRDRVLALVTRGTLTDEQVANSLRTIQEKEDRLKFDAAVLSNQFGNQPSEDVIKALAEKAATIFEERVSAKRWILSQRAREPEYFSRTDARALVLDVFDGKQPDGRANGVYVEAISGQASHRRKQWSFRLHGKVIDGWECVTKTALG